MMVSGLYRNDHGDYIHKIANLGTCRTSTELYSLATLLRLDMYIFSPQEVVHLQGLLLWMTSYRRHFTTKVPQVVSIDQRLMMAALDLYLTCVFLLSSEGIKFYDVHTSWVQAGQPLAVQLKPSNPHDADSITLWLASITRTFHMAVWWIETACGAS